MMTKTQALNSFWSSFGMMAYEESRVPTGENAPSFPYITYQVATDCLGAPLALSGSVWDRDRDKYSAVVANNKVAEKISKHLGRGGVTIPCEGGLVWIQQATPFAQNMGDDIDNTVHRKIINISVEFMTEY